MPGDADPRAAEHKGNAQVNLGVLAYERGAPNNGVGGWVGSRAGGQPLLGPWLVCLLGASRWGAGGAGDLPEAKARFAAALRHDPANKAGKDNLRAVETLLAQQQQQQPSAK